MTVLPVVSRELRVASRRPWTYWSRLVAGGIAVAMTSWVLLADQWLRFGNSGGPLFYMIASLAFCFSLLGGLVYSADSVSSEKRDGTLGLLFLTDLRGWDVTLGKLAATSLGGLYGLLAVLPLMALSLLKGGILLGDYGRMVLLLVTTLFCSLSIGLLASVLTTDVRRSVFLTFMLLLVVIAIAPLAHDTITWLAERSARRGGWLGPLVQSWELSWLRKVTPFESFTQLHGAIYQAAPQNYWRGLTYTGAIGLLCFAYASWRLPSVWQEKGLGDPRKGFRGWLDRVRYFGSAGKNRFRARWLDDNPVAWISGRYWIRRLLVWLFLGTALLGIWAVGSMTNDGDWWNEPEVLMFVCFGFHLVLKFWIANEAPRQFIDDRQTGALELLLSTPLTVREILQGRWLALWRQFGWPTIAVLLLDVGGLWWLAASQGGSSSDNEQFASWIAAMVTFVMDLWALGWDGLWVGLTSRSRTATTWMLTRILVLPWLAWLGFLTSVASAGWTRGIDTFDALLMIWIALGLGNSLFWGLRARYLLLGSFRDFATMRAANLGWWPRWREQKTPTS